MRFRSSVAELEERLQVPPNGPSLSKRALLN